MLETQKKTAIESFANESPCICFNLRKASRAITHIYDGMFKHIGITASQAAILFALQTVGPMTISELAMAMATDRTTITRNLKPIDREGLVHIEANIEAIKEALEQETKKREQYLQHIAEAQAILSMHGRKDLH